MTSDDERRITAMREGGQRLRRVKKELVKFCHVGTTFEEIEAEAQRLIKEEGAIPNFALVKGYDWATCVMVNDALCHGIPKNGVLKDGDVVSIDVGLLYKKYNLDTSISFGVGKLDGDKQRFLEVGKQSLKRAISKAKVGASIYDVSRAMQKVVETKGYSAVYQLTGHGIGLKLHDDPAIPCVALKSDKKIKLHEGQTVAIEIMYTAGRPEVKEDSDGWTFRTVDGSLSGMFEETVLVTKNGPEVLT